MLTIRSYSYVQYVYIVIRNGKIFFRFLWLWCIVLKIREIRFLPNSQIMFHTQKNVQYLKWTCRRCLQGRIQYLVKHLRWNLLPNSLRLYVNNYFCKKYHLNLICVLNSCLVCTQIAWNFCGHMLVSKPFFREHQNPFWSSRDNIFLNAFNASQRYC